MKQRLMDLYFTEGADLSDREVLVKAAADVGLDADTVRDMLASDADVERVEQAANSAKEAGIDGVPTFIIGGVAAVSGAQDPRCWPTPSSRSRTTATSSLEEQRGGPGAVLTARSAAPAPGSRSPRSMSRASARRCAASRALRRDAIADRDDQQRRARRCPVPISIRFASVERNHLRRRSRARCRSRARPRGRSPTFRGTGRASADQQPRDSATAQHRSFIHDGTTPSVITPSPPPARRQEQRRQPAHVPAVRSAGRAPAPPTDAPARTTDAAARREIRRCRAAADAPRPVAPISTKASRGKQPSARGHASRPGRQRRPAR